MPAKALRRAIRDKSRMPNATRSSGEVLRNNTSPRRGENCGKLIVPEIQYILAGGSSRPETANVSAVHFPVASTFFNYGLQRAPIVLLNAAVMSAVTKINHQPDNQPDNQSRPIDPTEFVHHVTVEENA
jgi:hypothetical protein